VSPALECPGGDQRPARVCVRTLGLELPRAGAERLPEKNQRFGARAPSLASIPRGSRPRGAHAVRNLEVRLANQEFRTILN